MKTPEQLAAKAEREKPKRLDYLGRSALELRREDLRALLKLTGIGRGARTPLAYDLAALGYIDSDTLRAVKADNFAAAEPGITAGIEGITARLAADDAIED